MKYLYAFLANFKAKMLNRKASDPENKPDQIIGVISLKPGQNVADIGAGGGYFSLRFAGMVGAKGKVYAIDTNPGFLEFVKKSAKERGLGNVIPVLAAEDKFDLPEKCLDLIYMRNVTHHIQDRAKYFAHLKNFLKSDGKIIVIEYENDRCCNSRMSGHRVPKETIVQEMKKAGYSVVKEFDFLPEQHFTIYSRRQEIKK